MLDLAIDRDSGVPVTTQLAWRLRSAIESGDLKPGDRLPSLRDAAEQSGANVNTVRAVYAKLAAAGVVATEQGRGTFVSEGRADGELAERQRLQSEIARLEAELVSLPLLPSDGAEVEAGRRDRPRLLSVEDLAGLRDVLAARVDELRVARGEIVRRIEAGEAPATRRPSSRSSSSLAGARVRWTGA